MAENSIYERIAECIEEFGQLPADFVVEEKEYREDELRFAPGTLEGVLGHHLTAESDIGDFVNKLKGYQEIAPQDAMYVFETLEADNFKTASMRAGICRGVTQRRVEFDPAKLADIGACFMQCGTKIETVKLGLVLLSMFDLSKYEKVREKIKTLGYCEDFTYYVMNIAQRWPEEEQQTLYFELAQKLKGWGKINAVDKLKGNTVKKQKWILCYGAENNVRSAYSARTCVDESNMIERMKTETFAKEELEGAGVIVDGLLDEGPRPGMSTLENPVEFTLLYLGQCANGSLTLEQIALFAGIKEYFKDGKYEGFEKIEEKINELLAYVDINRVIADNIDNNTHKCVQIANAYDIDITEKLIELIDKNFEKYYTLCHVLFAKDRYVERFLEICDREIKAELYPRGMGNSLGLGALPAGAVKVDMIVQYLSKYPLGGKGMITICLQSPITRWRNVAAKALLAWTESTGNTLSKLDSGLYSLVKEISKIELNPTTRGMWKKLI